jgi:hypothetical protein
MDISAVLASPAGLALKGALALTGVDFLFGVYAASRDGTFAWDAIAAFVRKHLLGRVFPIGTLLVIGYASHDGTMSAAGLAAGAAYVVETAASVYGSINPPAASVSATASAGETANPVPTD